MFNPAIARLTAPPVAIVQNWIDQYQGDHGPLIDMSQAVPGYLPMLICWLHWDSMAPVKTASVTVPSKARLRANQPMLTYDVALWRIGGY